MAVLVTGGAGYIGSHMVRHLLDRGETVVVVDNLSTGCREAVADEALFHEGNAGDGALIERLVHEHRVDAIIHFAASIVVPDSIENPLAYYRNNSAVSLALIQSAVRSGVRHFIFSSTASVYGAPRDAEVGEGAALRPINPYGRSKLIAEWMLEDAAAAHDLSHVSLRYFNVAGADPEGRSGRAPSLLATHLIKRANQVALGRIPLLEIYGTDYATPDGTCVRDYIHVVDLVDAHSKALDYLRDGGSSTVLNCGYGRGVSVKEVVEAVERVSGHKLPVRYAPRRAGDPPAVVSKAERLKSLLDWKPRYDDLDLIVGTAYACERRAVES